MPEVNAQMIVHRGFDIKEKRAVAPGELVYVDAGGISSLAITLQNDTGGDRMFLVLQSARETRHPFYFKDEHPDGFVITYGTDWVLDIGTGEEIECGDIGGSGDIGSIVYSASQIYMRAGGVNQQTRLQIRAVNLQTFAFGTPSSDADTICIKSWKLWRTEERRTNPHADPMIHFFVS